MRERRALFQPALAEVSWLSPVNPYRPPLGVAPEDLAEHCAAELEGEILRCGPENVCAFVMEPIVGSAGGAVVPPEGYGERVREICTRYGVLLIADEIVCGCGRTGTWRASEQMGFVPDIMSVAKGLAAGVIPLAAAIYSDEVYEVIRAKHGAVATGHTFSGHTAACAAGLATQQVIARDGLVSKIKTQLGPYLFKRLDAAIGHLP
jgi:adenosylmethionine-8-amino-7-oxononanoate aminotransferase